MKKSGFKSIKWFNDKFRAAQIKLVKLYKNRSIQTPEERKLQKTLKQVMLKDFKTENKERKFRFEHIEKTLEIHKLNPKPDIVFIYGKKGIGKTWALSRRIKEMYEKNKSFQFIYIRNKQQDSGALHQQLSEDHWPIYMQTDKFFWKSEFDEKTPKTLKKIAGWFAYPTGNGFQRLQGGSYPNVKLIIWDECNDTDGNKLTPETLNKFTILTSSIIRGKTDVRTYMLGNLLDKNDQSMNIFLERMKIDPEARLKIIDTHKDNNPKKPIMSRLLYINALDEYSGIEEQKGLATQFSTDEELEKLKSNLPNKKTGKSVYSYWDFAQFHPILSIMFSLKEEGQQTVPYILYLAKIPVDESEKLPEFCLWIDKFNKYEIKFGYEKTITYEPYLSNKEVAPILVTNETFIQFITIIYRILKSGQLWYGYNNTEFWFSRIWPEWYREIIKYNKDNEIKE